MSIVEMAWVDPPRLVAALGDRPGLVWLDGSAADERSRMSYLCIMPRRRAALRGGRVWLDERLVDEDPLALLRHLLNGRVPAGGAPFGFTGGVIAMFGYGLGQSVQHRVSRHDDPHGLPDMVAARYDEVLAFDAVAGRAWIVSPEPARMAGMVAALLRRPASPARLPAAAFVPDMADAAYLAAVEAMRTAIGAGEIFQANLTQRLVARRPPGLRAVDVQLALRAASPAPFGSLVVWDEDFAYCGVSPERFLAVDAARRIEARPIKGTAPRGRDPDEDRRLAAGLAASAKDRAEHLMIVDLMRNDVGRVAELGSVHVAQLQAVERFAGVHHMVSAVVGRLAQGHDAIDLLAAALPGGSVTGAPKLQAMAVIDALEASARGPYCGSLAWLGDNDTMDSCILIRGLAMTRTHLVAGAGGAITSDSDPAAELAELELKFAAIRRVFGG